jgi:cell division protein FtsB
MKGSKPARWSLTLALLIAGSGLVWAVIPFRQILDQQRRVEAAAAELATLERENRMLEDEVAALKTPAEIERLAREKLGYVMPGDVPYVVVEPPDDTDTTPAPQTTLPEDVPWYRTIWEFFTGADLLSG